MLFEFFSLDFGSVLIGIFSLRDIAWNTIAQGSWGRGAPADCSGTRAPFVLKEVGI